MNYYIVKNLVLCKIYRCIQSYKKDKIVIKKTNNAMNIDIEGTVHVDYKYNI